MKHMMAGLICLVVLCTALAASGVCSTAYVPKSLSEWKAWVVHGEDRYYCPSCYDNANDLACRWPGVLSLEMDAARGRFSQEWDLRVEGWVPLPGDALNWPQTVHADTVPVPVVVQGNVPSVRLSAGSHTLTGTWTWNRLPQFIRVPPETGGISLSLHGKTLHMPPVDDNHRLWLDTSRTDGREPPPEKKPTLRVQVFRKIMDAMPLEMETRLRLTVSGDSRKEQLTGVLPDQMETIEAGGDLPMKLTGDNRLWIQLKAGEWEVRLRSVRAAAVSQLSVPEDALWHTEVWAVEAMPGIRLVRVEGGTTIDPSQTRMPDKWKQLPAYRVRKGETVRFAEVQRGSLRDAVPRLDLHRDLWIDFNGQGATVVDRITGFAGRRHFIGLDPDAYRLGRVTLAGEDQVVHAGENGWLGVEVERGGLNMTAVSRLDFASGVPFPIGWSETLRKAGGTLHVPTGWRLVNASGVNVPEGATWWNAWSLLDAFLVLVIAFAVFRIWGMGWAGLFLMGLGFIWQESGSPRWIWLFVVGVSGLYQYVAARGGDLTLKRMQLLKAIWGMGLLVLFGISLSFVFTQVRNAAFPQLARYAMTQPYGHMAGNTEMLSGVTMDIPMPASPAKMKKQNTRQVAPELYSLTSRLQVDGGVSIKAPTQTGPGIPNWRWQAIPVDFGKLVSDHPITFSLQSLWMQRLFTLIRMLLLIGMLWKCVRMAIPRGASLNGGTAAALVVAAVMAMNPVADPVHAADRGGYPPDSMLNMLKERLLEPSPCMPHCADVADATLFVSQPAEDGAGRLTLELVISAAADTAVPLPDSDGTWALTKITVDGRSETHFRRHRGYYWVYLKHGVHTVKLEGAPRNPETLRIRFQLRPMQLAAIAPGWRLTGVSPDGTVAPMMSLTRKRKTTAPEADAERWAGLDAGLTDFLTVKRYIRLGLEWEVETRVTRLSDQQLDRPAAVRIPLLAGELIRTPGFAATDGHVSVVLPEGKRQVGYTSVLPVSSGILLQAQQGVDWTDVWQLSADASWHVEAAGIPVSYKDGSRSALWYPRPGESLDLTIRRLDAAEGELMTIDSLRVDYHIGTSLHRAIVKGNVRTSIGQEFSLVPPPASILTAVRVNGRTLPVAQSEDRLVIPLEPGSREFEAEWQIPVDAGSPIKGLSPSAYRLPQIRLDRDVTNIDLYMHLPDAVWLLWTRGPQLGPAVLAWGYLLVILIAAVLLGFRRMGNMGIVSWFLLGVGMATLHASACILVAAWFLAMDARKRLAPTSAFAYNLSQIGFLIWTLAVVVVLFEAVRNGLLGIPDMQVAGNGSSRYLLHWTLDRSETGALPTPLAIFSSVWLFRLVMFCWALWLASRVVTWGTAALDAMRHGGFWKPIRKRRQTIADAVTKPDPSSE
ncbi:MAG: hypothetical protein CSA22_07265 [Deltaproteobacteria bacterium]|nr:MAG: hypothetical protein CSA22_07265 [Deltaproteobacteria bacterium]